MAEFLGVQTFRDERVRGHRKDNSPSDKQPRSPHRSHAEAYLDVQPQSHFGLFIEVWPVCITKTGCIHQWFSQIYKGVLGKSQCLKLNDMTRTSEIYFSILRPVKHDLFDNAMPQE